MNQIKNLFVIICCLLINLVQSEDWVLFGLQGEIITDIKFHPESDDIVFACSRSDFSSQAYGSLFKSIDDGNSWDTLLTHINSTSISIDQNNPDIIYLCLAGFLTDSVGILKTVDGGNNWIEINNGISIDNESSINTLAIDPINSNVLYAGKGGIWGGDLYKSINSGESWTPLGNVLGETIGNIEINPLNPNTIFVATAGLGIVLKSTNQGNDWIDVSDWGETGIVTIALDILDTNNIYAAVRDIGLFRSSNSGMNWEMLGDSLTNTTISNISINENLNILYLAAQNNGVFQYDITAELLTNISDGLESYSVGRIVPNNDNSVLLCATRNGIYMAYPTLGISSTTIRKKSKIITAFPNPINTYLYIQVNSSRMPVKKIQIYNILGQRIKKFTEIQPSSALYTLKWDGTDDLSRRVPNGIYFISVDTDDKRYSEKLLLYR